MDFDGTSVLHHAASNDQAAMCKFLIENGCKVNQTDKLGRTPLMDAAEIGSMQVINELVEHKADVNAVDRENHTALSYCIDFVSQKEPKFFECAVQLVEHGADANFPGKFANRTILHCAAAQGDLNLVQRLVEEHHADLRYYDNEGKVPLHYAHEQKHEEVEQYLEQADIRQSGGGCKLMMMMIITMIMISIFEKSVVFSTRGFKLCFRILSACDSKICFENATTRSICRYLTPFLCFCHLRLRAANMRFSVIYPLHSVLFPSL